MKKILSLLMVVFVLTGCYDSKNVENLAFIIAIGVDTGSTNEMLSYTFQIAKPSEFAGKSTKGETKTFTNEQNRPVNESKTSSLVNITIEAPSIFEAYQMLTTSLSKEPVLSQTKVIVFSKEVAKYGLNNIIYSFISSREFKPNLFLAVSDCKAYEYFSSVNPQLIANPALFYEEIFQQGKTQFFPVYYLNDFYTATSTKEVTPVLPMVGITKTENTESPPNYTKSGLVKNLMSISDGNKISEIDYHTIGMAVFDSNGNMVSQADAFDSVCFHILKGMYKEGYFTVYNKEGSIDTSVIRYSQKGKPQISVKIKDNKPIVYIDVNLQGSILSSHIDHLYQNNSFDFEKRTEELVKDALNDFLYKTSTVYKSDIIGFGEYAKKNFLFYEDWKAVNWAEIYKNSEFILNLNFDIKRTSRTL